MFEESICVCCMSTDNLFDLFSERKYENEVENFGKMLAATINIKLSETRRLNSICSNCVAKVKQYLDFKRNALKCIALLSSVNLTELISPNEIEILGLTSKISEDTNLESISNIQNEDTKTYFESIAETCDVVVSTAETCDDVVSTAETCDDVVSTAETCDVVVSTAETCNVVVSTAETCDDNLRTDEIIDELKITISPCTTDYSFKIEEECVENSEPAPKQDTGRQKRPSDNVPYKVNKDELTCRECGKDFATNKTLKEHYNTHFGYHKCNVCDKKFISFNSLKKHEATHQKGPFQCASCEKQFYNLNTLRSHKRLKHSTRPLYPCKLCNEAFTTLILRLDHLEREHAINVKKYKCEYCDERFRNASERWKHISYKHEIKWLVCPVCGVTCRKIYLREHVRRRHTQTKNGEKKSAERKEAQKRFFCKLCNQAFTQKVNLKKHIGAHIREMEYSGDAEFLILDKRSSLDTENNGLLSAENESTQESDKDSFTEPDFEFHIENSESDVSMEEEVPLIRTDIGFTSDFDD